MPQQKTAYVTGAASGIARAVTEMLVGRGYKVAIADIDHEGVKAVASQCKNGEIVAALQLNAADWNSQVQTFEDALRALGGRIDYVYPIAGIGERMSIPNDPKSKVFVKPDLSVLDVDLYGFLYTTSLAIQQMRRQEKDEQGFRGKSELISQNFSHSEINLLKFSPVESPSWHRYVVFIVSRVRLKDYPRFSIRRDS